MAQKKKKSKLWGGRFEGYLSDIAIEISESISFDKELWRYDINGSLAHARMLYEQKILTNTEWKKIEKGLKAIIKEFESNKIKFDYRLEDIHTHVESRLIELIGIDGKRLHTARSRNDQVALDTHLYLQENMKSQHLNLESFLKDLIELANRNKDKIWAGYTHTQIAQPVSLGHYLLAWFWKFLRDMHLLRFAMNETSLSPLGAGALAGVNYPIDRERVAELLNFEGVYENSMDAVSNRDYQLSYHFFASRFFIHISRLCEDLILYSSAEFQYVKMSDKVTTGSSIMPQKKNPDIAELLRGKSAQVISNLNALLLNLKSLPLTYNRDLQEDKIYLFNSVKQVRLGILGLHELIKNIEFFPENVIKNLNKGFSQATDFADYLVRDRKIPFREAHEMSGKLVKYAEQKQITLDRITNEEIQTLLKLEKPIAVDLFKLENCIASKKGRGSTSPERVTEQIKFAKKELRRVAL